MQDRFKVRVWHKKRKKMYDVLHFHTATWSNGGEWVTAKGFNVITQQDIHIQVEPKDGVIMQSTGLKDKNGKLIYEGDIVKDLIIPEIFYIVKWFNSGFYLESTISGSFLKFNDTQQEVIGNIYENSELLERNNDKTTR